MFIQDIFEHLAERLTDSITCDCSDSFDIVETLARAEEQCIKTTGRNFAGTDVIPDNL